MQKFDDLLDEVAVYYTDKLSRHGMTPRGVDWNGEESQTLRFQQLCNVIDRKRASFSVNDLGCGYGALHDFLAKEYPAFSYCGVDVSEAMIQAAEKRFRGKSGTRFVQSSKPDQVADYGVASGIFNVRLGKTDQDWQAYVESTLDLLHETSRDGFAFNCLTSYSDADKMHDYLYYADPRLLFDLCKRRYSRNVALLHDYGLYEFVILVRKAL